MSKRLAHSVWTFGVNPERDTSETLHSGMRPTSGWTTSSNDKLVVSNRWDSPIVWKHTYEINMMQCQWMFEFVQVIQSKDSWIENTCKERKGEKKDNHYTKGKKNNKPAESHTRNMLNPIKERSMQENEGEGKGLRECQGRITGMIQKLPPKRNRPCWQKETSVCGNVFETTQVSSLRYSQSIRASKCVQVR